MTRRFLVGLAFVVISCGKSGGTTTPEPKVLSVGGSYQTEVTLLASTCVGTSVQTFPTVVTHTPGASTLVLSHAGSAYPGTVTSTGAFVSAPRPYVLNDVTYTIGITGQFTATAMDATVTVQPGVTPPCEFSARWQGPKTGSPNVIP